MLEKDIIRNVLLNHQYANAKEYAGKYVDQILLEDSSNDDIKYLATKTFRNMIRYELQVECEKHTYTGSDFWDVHTMINFFLEQLKLHSIYSNTSADEVRHLGETIFFTCFKEDLFPDESLPNQEILIDTSHSDENNTEEELEEEQKLDSTNEESMENMDSTDISTEQSNESGDLPSHEDTTL